MPQRTYPGGHQLQAGTSAQERAHERTSQLLKGQLAAAEARQLAASAGHGQMTDHDFLMALAGGVGLGPGFVASANRLQQQQQQQGRQQQRQQQQPPPGPFPSSASRQPTACVCRDEWRGASSQLVSCSSCCKTMHARCLGVPPFGGAASRFGVTQQTRPQTRCRDTCEETSQETLRETLPFRDTLETLRRHL
mmetsp:Transcript_25942/g.82305  ORF Transcript_25942/g.82305 Transcript_25942/m.82305 type:complete len:193 (-) Transcript_25942:62-640(-)